MGDCPCWVPQDGAQCMTCGEVQDHLEEIEE